MSYVAKRKKKSNEHLSFLCPKKRKEYKTLNYSQDLNKTYNYNKLKVSIGQTIFLTIHNQTISSLH